MVVYASVEDPRPPLVQTPAEEILPRQVRIGDGVEILGVLFEVTRFILLDDEVLITGKHVDPWIVITCLVPLSQWLSVVRGDRT